MIDILINSKVKIRNSKISKKLGVPPIRIAHRALNAMYKTGGTQQETTLLGIPSLTLRNNTERPITVREGTNILVGANP